jgi:hypothetical protein
MLNIKQVLLASATFGVVATIGTMSPQSAQAAIVSGQVSGIWTFENDGPGGYQVGDPFTALYTYDDADLITRIDNSSELVIDSGGTYSLTSNSKSRSVSLLSLVVNSGSVSQVFALSNEPGSSSLNWLEFQSEEQKVDGTSKRDTNQVTSISVNGGIGSTRSLFQAQRQVSLFDGFFSDQSYAFVRLADYSNANEPFIPPINLLYASTDQPVTFSATDVPTPALLPGLIGLGLGAIRKRKAIVAAN